MRPATAVAAEVEAEIITDIPVDEEIEHLEDVSDTVDTVDPVDLPNLESL